MRHYIKRLLICIALLTANAAAWAETYVITDGTNYLCNDNGTLSNSTTFVPSSCIWTSTASSQGVKLNNGNYYLNADRQWNYNQGSYCTFSLTNNKNSAKTFYISSNKVYYYYYYGYYYYLQYSSGWSTGTETESDGASIYTISTVQSVDAKADNVTVTPASRFTYQGDETDFNLSSFSYTPAYTYYTVGDNNSTKYFCTTDGTYVGNTPPDKITSGFTYKWSTTASETNVTLSKTTEATAHATYDKKVDTQTNATVTATITIPQSSSAFMTTDATVTGTTNITLSNLLVPTISLNVPNEVYIGESVSGTLTTSSDGNITYTADPNSYVTLTNDASDSKKFTVKGNAVASGNTASLVKVAANVAASNNYIASSTTANITVKKRPTTLTLDETSKTITFGDAAPKLTCKVTDDRDNNKELPNPKVRYSSSETFITVDETGQITVKKAGSAVITASYAGDDTYAAAKDVKYTITVKKAPTTLSFENSAYHAVTTQTFTAPKATLTPNNAGSVTYSYTSETQDLITLDASTGDVTLGTVSGTAIVTATYKESDNYLGSTASYTLTVTTKPYPTGFPVSTAPKSELYVDETFDIQASTNSQNGLEYASSDASVLDIDTNGKMTAKKEGKVTVSITSKEDDTYAPQTKNYTVTVKRYPTKLTIGGLQDEYYTDAGEIPLSVSLVNTANNDEGVTGKTYIYKSSITSVLTVSQNASGGWVITPVGAGQATITVTFEGDDKYEGSSDSKKITVKRVAVKGDFIRIKNASGNYLTASADGSKVEWASATDEDASNIIYYGKDGSLLFYECGRYIKNATPTLATVGNNGYTGTAFTLTRSDDKYTISDGSSKTTNLTVEIVKSLPVTFKDAGHGYSTLYSPVNLRCPAGVTAYYAHERKAGTNNNPDYVINMKEVLHGVLPANTPLVLKASDITTVKIYNFYIIDETQTIEKDSIWSGLTGTCPTINTSSVYSGGNGQGQCPYTLQPTASSSSSSSSASTTSTVPVGFYPWKSDKHTTIDPFRCYIPGSSVSQAKGFRFAFDGGETSGIMTIDGGSSSASSASSSSSSSLIYNLQGVCVGNDINALPAGVYVRGGKKMVKK